VTSVLIADDDAGQRRLVELTLAGGTFVLLQAADGTEALRIALEQRPKLVFLDWQMPGLSGIEVCRALRDAGHGDGVQIVMLSGRDAPEDRAAGLAAGADDYLVKPFSPLELLDKVTDLLGPDALA